MVSHNNRLPDVHLRKTIWKRHVKTWFNQPANKKSRRLARETKAARVNPRPIDKLRPLVQCPTIKYNSKQRFGKGFTHEELRKAGLTAAFARTVGIAVDHRRVNQNVAVLEANVARLESYKSKLILFPRKEGKQKQGEIPDSTAERVASATQATASHALFNVPAANPRTKRVAISDELKNQKVYQKQRTVRTNSKYTGAREERARKAAEEEK